MSLEGKTILITRPRGQSREIQNLLESLGGTVAFQPVIEILPVDDDTTIRQYISGMELYGLPGAESTDGASLIEPDQAGRFIQNRTGKADFDWIIFSSANGVNYFMEYFDRNEPVYLPERPLRLAAIGPGTAAALLRFGLQADLVPDLHQAEGMAEALKDEAVQGKRFLSIRGNRGRDVLTTELVKWGGHVEELVVYRSVEITQSEPGIRDMLDARQIDVVTATSSSIARSLIKMFGEGLRNSHIVTISPLTSQVFRDAGYPVAGQAKSATIPDLVECVASLF